MKRRLRRTGVRVVLIVVSALGAALWTVDAVWSMQEPKEVIRMNKQMKTVCVGRFLIDIPLDAQVSINSAAVDGLAITSYGPESEQQFAERLARREQEINAAANAAGGKNMHAVQELDQDGVKGKVFLFDLDTGYLVEEGVKVVHASVAVNGYAFVNGRTFGFQASAYQLDKAGKAIDLFKRLQPLEAGVMPRQGGFCLDGAFLRDPLTAEQGERIVMVAGLPGHDDLGIALATIAGASPGPGLIERNKANRMGPYSFLNVLTSTLLEGQRTINGLAGDEFAFKARERNFTTGYAFDWETQGMQDDVLRPFISLELQTGISPQAGGEPVQSTLSEQSLGELWRRMSSSLRLRPVDQVANQADADLELGLALGTMAWAGDTCRQSGWWQCGDRGAQGHAQADAQGHAQGDAQGSAQGSAPASAFGGERRFLREGTVMPQALPSPMPGAWHRVRAIEPLDVSRRPTAWRLVDKRSETRPARSAGLAEPVNRSGPGPMANMTWPASLARVQLANQPMQTMQAMQPHHPNQPNHPNQPSQTRADDPEPVAGAATPA